MIENYPLYGSEVTDVSVLDKPRHTGAKAAVAGTLVKNAEGVIKAICAVSGRAGKPENFRYAILKGESEPTLVGPGQFKKDEWEQV